LSGNQEFIIMDIINQLTDIYINYENWHEHKLSEEEARKYFQRLIEKGNIISYTDNGSVVGYVEFWRINYEQWGRIVCGETFSAYTEDIVNGNIAYVANAWIHPDYRRTKIFRMGKMEFFKRNFKCDYFVGEARRKKCGLIKVFKKAELSSKIFKNGTIDND